METKTLQLFIMVCIMVVCGFPYTVSVNYYTISVPPAESNNACFTELCLTVLGIMEQFQRNAMPHYSRFFNDALMLEVRDMLRRLYGFAVNEVQGIQWESITVRFLQLYIIHVGAFWATSRFNIQQSYEINTNAPRSLQSLCLSQVTTQIMVYVNDEFRFPDVEDSVLRYELVLFTRLPILVTNSNTAPYLTIRLREDRHHTRFVDETFISSTLTALRVYRHPIPYSPAQNIANDVALLNRAQQGVIKFFFRHYEPLAEIVNANIVARLNEVYENSANAALLNPKLIETMRANYVLNLLLRLYMDWLDEENYRLRCNPVLAGYVTDKGVRNLIGELNRLQRQLFNLYKLRVQEYNNIAFHKMYEALQRANLIIGYSLRRSIGIAIVESCAQQVQLSSSTEASRAFTITT